MVTANLCKCLKCDVVLIDLNPQIGAKEHELTGKEIEMQAIEDKNGVYFVCPICETDGNLVDL